MIATQRVQMPERIQQNSLANARDPGCRSSVDGVGVYGCWGGTHFPVPQNSYQAMWSHLLSGGQRRVRMAPG